MTAALRKLRPAPALVPVTCTQAANLYPDSPEMQRAWLAAVHWMRSRPQGSVWLLDKQSLPPRWRSQVEVV